MCACPKSGQKPGGVSHLLQLDCILQSFGGAYIYHILEGRMRVCRHDDIPRPLIVPSLIELGNAQSDRARKLRPAASAKLCGFEIPQILSWKISDLSYL